MSFFEKLNFASSNEDGRSEIAALAGSRRIVCLTGSGTRPLDLLVSDAEHIFALDMNPVQNAALALKIAAIRQLDHTDYLAFLGILPSRDRIATYLALRASLSPDVQSIWDRRQRVIGKGIWYQGLWEKVLRFGAFGVRLLRGRAIETLFSVETLEEQTRIWQEAFDDRIWRLSIRLLGRRFVWSRIIGEPGGDFLPSPEVVETLLAGAFTRASQQFFFRDSDFAWLILRGCHHPDGGLPVHMEAESYPIIRQRLSRITVVNGALPALGQLGIGEIDGFSLSDFGSYCDTDAYAACWRGVEAVAEPGARFCERIFMNPLPLPLASIHPDTALSGQLTALDRAIIYDIRAGTIGA